MAVMVTDIILLETFNSLGLPTSTTVSLVFELLGATFAVSIFKLAQDNTGLTFADLLNTEKALSVIIGIFLSVAIAFVFGTVVQYLSRLWFSFDYRKGLSWKIGLFGGISITAIIYFLLIKGAKDMTFMTPSIKDWISSHIALLMACIFVASTALSQLLHWMGANVFKVIVLLGTFSLAMAFAGNDLVNFIGVPLTGFASYQDYLANGNGDPHGFMMGSLNAPAATPVYFLLLAGIIMVIALATSKKARKVVGTSVNLARQDAGDELFGSSRIARRLVRLFLSISEWIVSHTPVKVRAWIDKRLDSSQAIMAPGAAFDLVRGSINLVLAGVLISIGTSLKLPLSTTYVTFMVAMGTSLADRAWGRESAVFRITGVISVIGGWFITAGVAFIGAGLMVTIMHLGGTAAICITSAIAIIILLRRSLSLTKEAKEESQELFQSILSSEDPQKTWNLLKIFIAKNQRDFLNFIGEMQQAVTSGFLDNDHKALGKAVSALAQKKEWLKCNRRKATLCFRRIPQSVAIEKSAWFYLAGNAQMSILYNLRRIADVCHEHVDNNFHPIAESIAKRAKPLCAEVNDIIGSINNLIDSQDAPEVVAMRRRCDQAKDKISAECRLIHAELRKVDPSRISVLYVYLNMMQEQQEMLSSLRKLLRADIKLMSIDTPSLTLLEHA